MKLLCITSFMWIKNVIKAFQKKQPIMGIITSMSTLASVNLWRDYNKLSMRRKIDVYCARTTGVYYLYRSYVLDPTRMIVKTCNFVTASFFYMGSCLFFEKDNVFHMLFHLNIYKIQNLLLY